MRFLLTNDDGWGANGLKLLERVTSRFGEVVVVAPQDPQSGISHQLTLERPLVLIEQASGSYSLNGTPADCVRIAMTQLELDFDWVLSGINHGANLGADTYVSGTVAAAREGWLQGVNAVAFSQYHKRRKSQPFEWGPAEQLADRLLGKLLKKHGSDSRCLVNVNLPDLTQGTLCVDEVDIKQCELDPNPLPNTYLKIDAGFVYDGDYQGRPRKEGCDIDICFGGNVAMTVLG